MLALAGCKPDGTTVCTAVVEEIQDGVVLVKPVEGSAECSYGDILSLKIDHFEPSPEPQVGDTLEIEYNGTFTEEKPAMFAGVTHVKVVVDLG